MYKSLLGDTRSRIPLTRYWEWFVQTRKDWCPERGKDLSGGVKKETFKKNTLSKSTSKDVTLLKAKEFLL